jgi:2-polyprenyl-3-methyl-5-hydroxy-6-metoxy-1,4-benzoquinol methylase
MSASQSIPLKRYDAAPDLSGEDTHARVMRLVGCDKRVLELGCATGYMSRTLANQCSCVVTGVEVNPAAAEEARAACARVIVGDLDAIDWKDAVGSEQFDVIIAADVLEHLRSPARVLAALRAHLAEGGYLVASIPNVAHSSVLAELLQGRFTYRAFGLLDDTHIRFFTRDSIYQCLEEAGFAITHLDRLTLEPVETEFRTALSSFPAEVANWLASREEATTYQFILTAHPMAAPAAPEGAVWPRSAAGGAESVYRSVLEKLAVQPGLSALEGLLRAHAARVAYLEDTRAHQAETITRLEEALAKNETYIRAVTAESQARHEELSKAKPYVASLLAEIDRLRHELTSVGDQATRQRQALEAAERRLLKERQRLGDTLELTNDRLRREQEHDRKAFEDVRIHLTKELEDERRQMAREMEEERARQATERDRLEHLLAEMKASIDMYERSRSWRATAPLRAAARFFARSRPAR